MYNAVSAQNKVTKPHNSIVYPAPPAPIILELLPDVITLLTVWKRDFYSISQKSPVMRVTHKAHDSAWRSGWYTCFQNQTK